LNDYTYSHLNSTPVEIRKDHFCLAETSGAGPQGDSYPTGGTSMMCPSRRGDLSESWDGNAKTNELIREYVPSISMAGDLLGAKNKYRFQKAVQQRKSITFEP
jgi:hypothetical protein